MCGGRHARDLPDSRSDGPRNHLYDGTTTATADRDMSGDMSRWESNAQAYFLLRGEKAMVYADTWLIGAQEESGGMHSVRTVMGRRRVERGRGNGLLGKALVVGIDVTVGGLITTVPSVTVAGDVESSTDTPSFCKPASTAR
jgi:hypothetical protein